MSNIAPVDRVGGVVPIARRDHPRTPAAGDDPGGRERPAGSDPGEGRREPSPALEAPPTARHSTSGKIVDTFALSRGH